MGLNDLFGTENYNEKDVGKMYAGWTTTVVLPEFESISHGGLARGAATGVGVVAGGLAGGLIGFALASGSRNEQRKINTTVRIADKGIVIHNGMIDGKDLKIPWDYILNAQKENDKLGVFINLIEGETIKFENSFKLMSYSSPKQLANYINERATGKVEDGW